MLKQHRVLFVLCMQMHVMLLTQRWTYCLTLRQACKGHLQDNVEVWEVYVLSGSDACGCEHSAKLLQMHARRPERTGYRLVVPSAGSQRVCSLAKGFTPASRCQFDYCMTFGDARFEHPCIYQPLCGGLITSLNQAIG